LHVNLFMRQYLMTLIICVYVAKYYIADNHNFIYTTYVCNIYLYVCKYHLFNIIFIIFRCRIDKFYFAKISINYWIYSYPL